MAANCDIAHQFSVKLGPDLSNVKQVRHTIASLFAFSQAPSTEWLHCGEGKVESTLLPCTNYLLNDTYCPDAQTCFCTTCFYLLALCNFGQWLTEGNGNNVSVSPSISTQTRQYAATILYLRLVSSILTTMYRILKIAFNPISIRTRLFLVH